MKKISSLFFLTVFTLLLFSGLASPSYCYSGAKAFVVDNNGYLTEKDMRDVLNRAESFAEYTSLNVVVAICDDIGPDKSDRGVVDFADLMYEDLCGIDSDGLLLLINNDTEYDYISTSGKGINYYSDYRIERMFDLFFDYIKEKDYRNAAIGFLDAAEYFYDQGMANNQTDVSWKELDPYDTITFLAWTFMVSLFVGIFAGLIVGCPVYFSNKKKYSLQRAVTHSYILNNSLLFNQATDTYLGTFTRRTYSPVNSSSGRSGGSGRGSRSSTHRSSSGGRHGGGGRRR